MGNCDIGCVAWADQFGHYGLSSFCIAANIHHGPADWFEKNASNANMAGSAVSDRFFHLGDDAC